MADFGAGSGAYALELARLVGHTGMVYAVDVQKDLLTSLRSEARRRGLHNIEILWGNLDKVGGSKLRDASVDAVVLSNVLFQIENKEATAREVARVVVPGGRVLIVDWSSSAGAAGPRPEQLLSERRAREIFEAAGLALDHTFAAGSYHYGLIFNKVNKSKS